jgi:uncharacterized protein with PQ loop repeat
MPSRSENPFAPPGASVSDTVELKPGSPIRAVLLGLVVDIGGTLVIGLLIGIVYGVFLGFSGVPQSEIVSRADTQNPMSLLSLIAQALGLVCSVLGGYVCARIVKRKEYRVVAVMAVLSAIFGMWVGSSQYSFPVLLALTALSVLSNLFGAKLGRAENRRA